jgi:hypothetical protein
LCEEQWKFGVANVRWRSALFQAEGVLWSDLIKRRKKGMTKKRLWTTTIG